MRFLRLEFKSVNTIKLKAIKYIAGNNIAPLRVKSFDFALYRNNENLQLKKILLTKILVSEELNKID